MSANPELQRLERITADRAVREVGHQMTAHHFHVYYELFFVEQGAAKVLIGDRMVELGQADFLLIPPRAFHRTRYPAARCVRSIVYFRTEDISRRVLDLIPDAKSFLSRPQIIHIARQARPQFFELLTRLTAREEQHDPQTRALKYFYLQELFLLLMRYGEFRPLQPQEAPVDNEQVLSAARFIHLNYMHPITAAEIAAASGFSPNHLSRKFRQATGAGTHEYLIRIRLQHAALALASTEDSITQVALSCGFSDSNYFKDVFKKNYGMTPRDYRKRQKDSPT